MRNLLLLFILFQGSLFAQIPNPGFESWIVGNWLPNPQGWTTPNDQFNTVVSQDTDSYEGDFAMRVEAMPDGIGGFGWAECTIPIDYIPSSLDFYAKSDVEFGGVNVVITFFNNDFLFTSFNWSSGESIEDWTLISIPMEQNEPVLTHAVIRVEALYGDLVPGSAWISVDAMGFDGPLSSSPLLQESDFRFFPNPARDQLIIEDVLPGSTIRIINLTGQTIYTETGQQSLLSIDVSNFPTGLYLLSITEPNQITRSQKLVVR